MSETPLYATKLDEAKDWLMQYVRHGDNEYAKTILAALSAAAEQRAEAMGRDSDVAVGYAQRISETCGGGLLLMQTLLEAHEIHDNGQPLYRLYRGTLDLRAKPAAIASGAGESK